MMRLIVLILSCSCVPIDAQVSGNNSVDTAQIGDFDETGIDTDTNDTVDSDTNDTENPDTQDPGEIESIITGWHLLFEQNLFLHHEYPNNCGGTGGLGSCSYPLIATDSDWGFGFSWAPDSPETSNYLFGMTPQNGETNLGGPEISLFKVGNNLLSIQFQSPTGDQNNFIPRFHFVTMKSNQFCRDIQLYDTEVGRTYTREELEQGFKLIVLFEHDIHDNELDGNGVDKFIVGLETISGYSGIEGASTFEIAMIHNNVVDGFTVENCPSVNGDEGTGQNPGSVLNVEFGQTIGVNGFTFGNVRGRVDNLVVFQTNGNNLLDFSTLFDQYYDSDIEELHANINSEGGDKVFRWGFSIPETDAANIYDESDRNNFEPGSGHMFEMRQKLPNSTQTVDHETALMNFIKCNDCD